MLVATHLSISLPFVHCGTSGERLQRLVARDKLSSLPSSRRRFVVSARSDNHDRMGTHPEDARLLLKQQHGPDACLPAS